MIADIEEHDRHPALGERKRFSLVEPFATDSGSPGLVAEDDAGLLAYLAFMEERDGYWTVELAVRPDYRRRSVLQGLLQWVDRQLRTRRATGIRLWAYVPEVAEAAERSGFRLERELHNLRAPLPLAEFPRFASGIEVRGFREGVDEDVWLKGNNLVFAGHPENGDWGIADLDRRRRRSWFSSEGLRMAWDGKVLAGFCWTKVPSPQAGEIYVIGVLPGYQGMGLGKALLLEGISHMHTFHHARACVLYVDGANLPAMNLYKSMGFGLHHTDHSYLKRLETNPPPTRAGTLPVG